MSMYGVPYTALEPGEGEGAKQSMRDECDVNLIVARFSETGLISHLASGVPRFADVSEFSDFRGVLEQVREVESYFAGLPAKVRRSFADDASLFMDYLESGASEEDLKKRGLELVGDRRADQERQRRRDDASKAANAAAKAAEPPVEPPDAEAGTVLT